VLAGAFIGLASAWAAAHLAHRLRWGVNPYLHFGIVALASVAAVLLVVDDGGYDRSLWIRLPIAMAGIGAVARNYVLPSWRAHPA